MKRLCEKTKKADKKKNSKLHNELQSKDIRLKLIKESYKRLKIKKVKPETTEKQRVYLCKQINTQINEI